MTRPSIEGCHIHSSGVTEGDADGPSVALISAVSPVQASRTRQVLLSGLRCDRQHDAESG